MNANVAVLNGNARMSFHVAYVHVAMGGFDGKLLGLDFVHLEVTVSHVKFDRPSGEVVRLQIPMCSPYDYRISGQRSCSHIAMRDVERKISFQRFDIDVTVCYRKINVEASGQGNAHIDVRPTAVAVPA